MVLIPGYRNPLIPIRALIFVSALFVVLIFFLADWRRKHAGGAEANATCVLPRSQNRAPFPEKSFPLPTFYAPRFLAATFPLSEPPPKEIKLVSQSFF